MQAAAAGNGISWCCNDVGGSSRSRIRGTKCRSRVATMPAMAMHKEMGMGMQIGPCSSCDVATLGNLCVDIVLNVPSLPPAAQDAKFAYMCQLESCPPDESAWEAGGICNFSIAAARLGLDCVSIGHAGNEMFGKFLNRVMENEGVRLAAISGDKDLPVVTDDFDGSTLLCWVLVDPDRRHAFCSRFDFAKVPIFSRITRLPSSAEAIIRASKVLHFNGFAFDELLPSVVLSAVDCAHDSGSAVFFDPGPRGESLFKKDGVVLETILKRSDVLLLTAEEAATLTGFQDPYVSARVLLDKGTHTKWVIIKLGADGSLLADQEGCHHVPGFKVDVIDTVGCGDSFAAAIVLGFKCGLAATTTLALANAVGAATAMGCGAGRNVATVPAIHKVLQTSDFQKSCSLVATSFSSSCVRKEAARILDKLVCSTI